MSSKPRPIRESIIELLNAEPFALSVALVFLLSFQTFRFHLVFNERILFISLRFRYYLLVIGKTNNMGVL